MNLLGPPPSEMMFDISLAYVVHHSDGTRDFGRTRYYREVEARDEELALAQCRTRLEDELSVAGRMRPGDCVEIVGTPVVVCSSG